MKNSIAVLAFLSVLIFSTGNASAVESGEFKTTGAEWEKWCNDSIMACNYYIRGMLDANTMLNSLDEINVTHGGNTLQFKHFCIPVGTTVATISTLIRMHFEAKPEMLKQRISINFLRILRAEYPCEKKQATIKTKVKAPMFES